MEKITVGRQKKREITETKAESENSAAHSDLLTAIGLCTMCFMLMLSMLRPTVSEVSADPAEAVAVMSNAVETVEREELVMPDKKASVVGEESFFETIGEFFASLIMGEG